MLLDCPFLDQWGTTDIMSCHWVVPVDFPNTFPSTTLLLVYPSWLHVYKTANIKGKALHVA